MTREKKRPHREGANGARLWMWDVAWIEMKSNIKLRWKSEWQIKRTTAAPAPTAAVPNEHAKIETGDDKNQRD